MQFQFSFKHMQVSESLKSYTEGKVKSLVKKFVTKPIEAKITFSVDKHRHEAHLALMGGDGFLVILIRKWNLKKMHLYLPPGTGRSISPPTHRSIFPGCP